MKTGPLVSIIVNNYNYGQFLAEAVESALAQTYGNVEVIVVDDGSTDHSRDVIGGFGARVTAILKQNEGQASSFNVGFAHSKGAIVIFLDADDLLLPGAAEAAVDLMADGRAVKVHWNLWEIDERGRRLGTLHKGELVHGNFRDEFVQSGPISVPQSPTSGNAWARWFLDEVMPLPEHKDKHGADGFLKKLCPVFGQIRRTEEPLGCYRIHGASYGGCRDSLFRFRRGLTRYPAYCELLAAHLQRMGVEVQPADWMGPGSQFEWLGKAVALYEEMDRLIPQREPFILLDDNALAYESVGGRRSLPFLNCEGQYWGPPETDEHAIQELAHMNSEGIRFLAIAFPAFWWLEVYAGFFRHVDRNYFCLCDNERLRLFRLQTNSGGKYACT